MRKTKFGEKARRLVLTFSLGTLLAGLSFAQDVHPVASLVETEPGVKIEVLDWGGSGPPLVLLAGLEATARGQDEAFVLGLRTHFHVFGITRRGFGNSSAPIPTVENYAADRLADDVLGVIDHLQLAKPLLVGHSFAGEELSSIGSRAPGRVAGLVYMDAGYRYALSAPALNDLQIDTITMRRYLAHALDDVNPLDRRKAAQSFLSELPEFEKELRGYAELLKSSAPMGAEDIAKEEADRRTPVGRAEQAIQDEEQRYSSIRCPALVIFAYPHALPRGIVGQSRADEEKNDLDFVDQRVRLFKAQPEVTVVLLPHATHDVQISRRDEVLAAIVDFATRLKVLAQ